MQKNPDGSMTVVEHLYELRYRLGWAVFAAIIGSIVGCVWFRYSIAPIPTLGDLVEGPYKTLPASGKLAGLNGGQLLQTQPFEGFKILLKVGVTAGVVLSSPAWLYQIWAFITPGLHRKERRLGVAFVVLGSLLFLLGALIAYIVLPEALRVLTGVGGADFVTAFAATDYVSFLINLLVIFGVSFELPLLVVMLNFVGILKYEKVKGWRRGLIFAVFVFAAFATPGSDPFSMLALAGALTVLLEISMQIARIHDKRKAKKLAADGWDTDNPDDASELSHTPEPVSVGAESAAPEPAAPEPIAPAPTPDPTPPHDPRDRYDDVT